MALGKLTVGKPPVQAWPFTFGHIRLYRVSIQPSLGTSLRTAAATNIKCQETGVFAMALMLDHCWQSHLYCVESAGCFYPKPYADSCNIAHARLLTRCSSHSVEVDANRLAILA